MRDTVAKLGKSAQTINPSCPVDLITYNSVQTDAKNSQILGINEDIDYQRNKEWFKFFKWGEKAFKNFKIVPPASGILHQVNLEYLARGVFNIDGLLYTDSVIGIDSHLRMINGLGIIGWQVGGVEAGSVMRDQPISMILPQVIGFKLVGKLSDDVTATDLVLAITETLRKKGVVGRFVEFYREGCKQLTLEDRTNIENMAPEYGATMCYFPSDEQTLKYFKTNWKITRANSIYWFLFKGSRII